MPHSCHDTSMDKLERTFFTVTPWKAWAEGITCVTECKTVATSLHTLVARYLPPLNLNPASRCNCYAHVSNHRGESGTNGRGKHKIQCLNVLVRKKNHAPRVTLHRDTKRQSVRKEPNCRSQSETRSMTCSNCEMGRAC